MKKALGLLLAVVLILLAAIPVLSFAETSELRVNSVTIGNKTYDGTPYPTSISINTTPKLSGDIAVVFITKFEDANVGTNKKVMISEMELKGSDAGKYTLVWNAPTEYRADINPRPIYVAFWEADGKEYDGTTATNPVIVPYNVADADEGKISIVGDAAFEDADVGTSKKVYLSNLRLVGDDAVLANYKLDTYANVRRANITPKAITVSGFDVSDKDYDGNAAAKVAAQYSGVLEGEDVAVTASGEFRSDDWSSTDVNAGTKNVQISVGLSGTGKTSNYALSYDEELLKGKAKIRPLSVTVSGIQAKDKEEDGTTDVTLDCSAAKVTGLLSGDTVGVKAAGHFEDAKPGLEKKVIIDSIQLTGSKAGNYKLAASGQQAETSATIVASTKPEAPALESVKFAKTQATVKQNVTITAVTNTVATKLTLYSGSKAVRSWTKGYTDKDGKRTWKVTYAFSSAGKRTVSFKAEDDNGVLTAAKKASITITEAPAIGSVKFSKTRATVKQKVTITAVTSTNTTKLAMYSGSTLAKAWTSGYTDKDGKRTWKVTYAFAGAGKRTLSFKAIDANGAASAVKKAAITITKAPVLSSVKFSKAQAKVKEKITITAVTNTTTAKLTMYSGSKAVKSWTEGYTDKDGKRVWKVKYAFSGAGNRTLGFKGFDANGVGTAAKKVTVKITK